MAAALGRDRRAARPPSLGSPHRPESHRVVRRVHQAPGWNRPRKNTDRSNSEPRPRCAGTPRRPTTGWVSGLRWRPPKRARFVEPKAAHWTSSERREPRLKAFPLCTCDRPSLRPAVGAASAATVERQRSCLLSFHPGQTSWDIPWSLWCRHSGTHVPWVTTPSAGRDRRTLRRAVRSTGRLQRLRGYAGSPGRRAAIRACARVSTL
jgi:hypothetical protein